jgi:hypothetical protein
MEIESTEAICPHCGQVNQISGLAIVDAFVCVRCSGGVGLWATQMIFVVGNVLSRSCLLSRRGN